MTEPNNRGMSRPFILISNDDGYKAAGINTLIDTLHPMADLLVVAPGGGRSGYGCAITSTAPIHNRLVCTAKKDWKFSLAPVVPSIA